MSDGAYLSIDGHLIDGVLVRFLPSTVHVRYMIDLFEDVPGPDAYVVGKITSYKHGEMCETCWLKYYIETADCVMQHNTHDRRVDP